MIKKKKNKRIRMFIKKLFLIRKRKKLIKKLVSAKRKKKSVKKLVSTKKKKKLIKKSVPAKRKKKSVKKLVSTKKKKKALKKSVPAKRKKESIKKLVLVKRKKQAKTIVMVKSEKNPIILPKAENDWESWQTFNPGVVLLNNKVHFLYRAIGNDGLSRLGYAVSSDGFHIDKRISYPVYEHQLKQCSSNISFYSSGGSWGGCEDPRIVQVDKEDILYVLYTACDGGLKVALNSINVKDFIENKWRWKSPKLISPLNETHKNWVIFPEKIKGKYAILHSINPEISIAYLDDLKFENSTYISSSYGNNLRKDCWDINVRGVGPPPIKTKDGWLIFYHAMDNDLSKYKIGAMLLDLQDPTKILYRAKEPVLEPEEFYENNGFKSGVVYASGAVVKDGNILLYYGGADNYICVAYSNLKDFLEALKQKEKPKFKLKNIKKK